MKSNTTSNSLDPDAITPLTRAEQLQIGFHLEKEDVEDLISTLELNRISRKQWVRELEKALGWKYDDQKVKEESIKKIRELGEEARFQAQKAIVREEGADLFKLFGASFTIIFLVVFSMFSFINLVDHASGAWVEMRGIGTIYED